MCGGIFEVKTLLPQFQKRIDWHYDLILLLRYNK